MHIIVIIFIFLSFIFDYFGMAIVGLIVETVLCFIWTGEEKENKEDKKNDTPG